MTTLAFLTKKCHTSPSFAGVAQRLERRPVTPEAAGSNPVIRAKTKIKRNNESATIAQSVEHSTENARVPGSSPGCGTILRSALSLLFFLLASFASAQLATSGQRFLVTCADVPELCVVRDIDFDGHISLPLIGLVTIANAPIAQLDRIVSESASRALGRLIEVHLSPLRPRVRTVRVLGAVSTAVSVNLHGGRRLSEVVTEAGLSASADPSSITLTQASGRVTEIDLRGGNDCKLQPGDQIEVSRTVENQEIGIVGGVVQPGTQNWRPGLTVADVIRSAGGLSPHARGDLISLRRSNGPPESIGMAAASDLVLRRGDQISIPTVDRPVFVSVVGNVARPGLAAFAEGTRFATLFQEVGGLGADPGPMVVIITRTTSGPLNDEVGSDTRPPGAHSESQSRRRK